MGLEFAFIVDKAVLASSQLRSYQQGDKLRISNPRFACNRYFKAQKIDGHEMTTNNLSLST